MEEISTSVKLKDWSAQYVKCCVENAPQRARLLRMNWLHVSG